MERILMVLFLVLVGCKNTDDGRYSYMDIEGKEVKFVDGDDLVPPIPDSDLNDESLAGVDFDGDNVRDDVEIWINEEGNSKAIRMTLKDIARNLSLGMVNYKNEEFAYKYNAKVVDGISCLGDIYGLDFLKERDLVDDIVEIVINNKARKAAYKTINKNLSGSTFPLNMNNACHVIDVPFEYQN